MTSEIISALLVAFLCKIRFMNYTISVSLKVSKKNVWSSICQAP
jgi:hypothetical protein